MAVGIFFSSPLNLATITPPWLNFEVCSRVPDQIHSGLIIEYRVSPVAGLPLRWLTEITQCRPPFYFVDEQRTGPYRLWHHQHHFEQTDNGTLMTDTVHYQLPYGVFGAFLHPMVERKLLEIFNFRQQKLQQLFGNSEVGENDAKL